MLRCGKYWFGNDTESGPRTNPVKADERSYQADHSNTESRIGSTVGSGYILFFLTQCLNYTFLYPDTLLFYLLFLIFEQCIPYILYAH